MTTQSKIDSVEIIGSTSSSSPIGIFRSRRMGFDASVAKEAQESQKEERQLNRADKHLHRRSSIEPRLGGQKVVFRPRELPPSSALRAVPGVHVSEILKFGAVKIDDVNAENTTGGIFAKLHIPNPESIPVATIHRHNIAQRGDSQGSQGLRALEASFQPGGITGFQVSAPKDNRPAQSIVSPELMQQPFEHLPARARKASIREMEKRSARKIEMNGEKIMVVESTPEIDKVEAELAARRNAETFIQKTDESEKAKLNNARENAALRRRELARANELAERGEISAFDHAMAKRIAGAAETRLQRVEAPLKEAVKKGIAKGHHECSTLCAPGGCRGQKVVRDGIVKRTK